MRIAGDLSSGTATTNTSTTDGDCTVRWSAPEILDPERFGFKRGGPTKKSDIYSMGMTIYEVSFLQHKLGGVFELVLDSDGQNPILRMEGTYGNARYRSRSATPKTDLYHHPGLHRGTVGVDDILLGRETY